MKISTRGRYGLRLLIDLAGNAHSSHVTLASVAERQQISERYLEQVATILRRAGFIRSVKGAAGGYALAKPAGDILVGEALRFLEGDMLIIDPPPMENETKIQRCIRLAVFDRLNERIAAVIDTKTLAQITGDSDAGTYMYFI
jgi:Rrf2 family protein